MKSKFLFFAALVLLTSLSLASQAAAPLVTITSVKDACRDLLDAGGNPGTDGTLDNGSAIITVTSGIPPATLFILGPVNYVGIPMTIGVPFLASNLKPGIYFVIVQDGNTSDFNGSFTINGTTDITAGITPGFPINSTSCGTPNGQIAIDVSGGTGSYTYSWTATNGFTASTQDISGLTAGDYTVVVSDNGTNCTQTIGPITITEPPPPSNAVLILSGASPICVGESSTIRVDFTGGTGPFTLTITNLGVVNNYTSGADISVSPVASTTYTLTGATDVNGCPSTAISGAVTINVNPTPAAPGVTFTPTTYCEGDAIIPPTITTPTGGSTYNWYDDVALTNLIATGTNPTNGALGFSSVSANVRTVYVTETSSLNCTGPATTITLTVNANPVAPGISFSPDTYCVGQPITPPVVTTPVGTSTYTWYDDVSLSIILTTGTSPTNAQLGFSSVVANVKTVYVTETNVNNCEGPATPVTLTVNSTPVAPGVTFSPSTYCLGDAITPPAITAPVGTSTYRWYSDAGLTTLLTTGTNPANGALNFSSASANVTTVFVTETTSSNCTGPASAVTLTVNAIPSAPAVTFTPSSYCEGQPITPPFITTPTGGSTYRWYSDVSLSTLLTTGTNPTNAQLGFSSVTATTVTVFVTETNSNNCTSPATSVTLTVNPVPVAPGVTFTPSTYCVGNIITPPVITTPIGGSTYRWYSDAGLTTLLTTGSNPTTGALGFSSAAPNSTTVFVTETTSANCTGPATPVTLTVNAVPAGPAVTFTPSTYCVGEAIAPPTITTPVGGSTYTWYSDVSLSVVLTTGTNPTNAQLGFSSAAPNSTTVFVTETNIATCEGPATAVTLTVNPVPGSPAITFAPTTYCVGDAITPPVVAAPVGGSTYTWYSDAGLTSVLTTGTNPTNLQLGFSTAGVNVTTVFVTETNGLNCEGIATAVTLTVNATPSALAVTFTPNTYCIGDAITPPVITAPVGTSTYRWYSDAGLTTLLTSGTNPTNGDLGFSSASANVTTVFVTETTNSNCTGPATSVTLTVNTNPVAPAVTFSPSNYCVGQVITAPFITTPTGGSTYRWYSDAGLTTLLTTGTNPTNGALNFSSAAPTTVTVFVTETNSNNCISPATTVTLTVNAIPIAPVVTFTPNTYCVGEAIVPPVITTPTGGSTYSWYSDAGLTTLLATGTSPTNAALGFNSAAPATTTVFVTETSSANCTSTATAVTLTVNPVPGAPGVTFTPNSYCVGEVVTAPTITTPVGGSTYNWYSDAGLTTLITTGTNPTNGSLGFSSVAANTTTVFVTETNSLNCEGPATSVTLTVVDIPVAPAITFAPDTYCVGEVITPPFVTTPTGGSTYTWYDDAGLTITLTTGTTPTNAQLGFSSAAAISKTIFVTETKGPGCEGPATAVMLTVNAVPAAPAVTFTPSTHCVGDVITPPVISTPTGGSVYSWYSDAGLSTLLTTGTNPTNAQLGFSSTSANTTTVFVTETNTGCTSAATAVTLTVNALPTAELTGTTSICVGQSTDLTIDFTGTGPWTFQYSDGTTTFPGNSATNSVTISVNPVSTTTYTLISVNDTNCTGTIIGTPVTITVDTPPSNSLAVFVTTSPVCSGGSSAIEVAASELGVSYQLRNDADDSTIGTPVIGTGATISLPTGSLTATTTFNVLATRGACAPVELTSTATVTVLGVIDTGLAITAQDAAVCSGSGTNIRVAASESGVTYQLRNDADDSLIGTPVAGTGAPIDLPTGNLTSLTVFNVLASNGTCSIEMTTLVTVTVDVNPNPALTVTGPSTTLCSGGTTVIDIGNSEVGVSYQLRNDADDSVVGAPLTGTGSTLSLPTGALTASTTFNVLASSGVCAPVELTTIVTVTVGGSINLALTVTAQNPTLCSGSGTNIQIANSEVGVNYQLRNDADNSLIGTPVAGTGASVSIPTGNLNTTTTFNVIASNATCAAMLTNKATVTVNLSPDTGLTVTALSTNICFGTTTSIEISNSEVGVSYQLRDNATNNPIGSAVTGTGSTLSLPTGALTANTTFNVLASLATCSGQLTDVVTVTVLPSGDPLCAPLNNCATVSITPVTTLATCGAAAPDGTVTFDIVPATPVVNIVGVIVDIDGPLQKTQFNNFLFTDLPAGLYDYTVTYGDATNPACIKQGNFTIDPTGSPDFVDFNIVSVNYECLTSAGEIVLGDFQGAVNTDYSFEIYQAGAIVQSGVITKDQAASGNFTIGGLALGDYEVQLFQDQSAVNGCVGVARSRFKSLNMEEPAFGCDLFIPNVFTPNGDGSNDLLVIRNLPANSQISITNRWGKEVYSSTDYKNDWTGGDTVDGVYYYRLRVADQTYTGWLEIMRGK